MVIKNLLPAYNNRFLSLPNNSFAELCDCVRELKMTLILGN